MKNIRIVAGEVELKAQLNDSSTSEALWQALPLESNANRWGEEIYFSIPTKCELAEDARAEMQVGELSYWPPGSAFCIFWGPTPASLGDEPRAASPVNPVGMIEGDCSRLNDVVDGTVIRIEAAT
jgi:hypothetical protein